MTSFIKWSVFANRTVNMLGKVKPGESLLILADTNTDMNLAQACLAEGLNVTPNCQLMVIRRMPHSEKSEFNPCIHEAMVNSDVVIGLCETRFIQTEACREATKKGTRVLSTVPVGIEEYVIKGIVEVDYEGMVKNGEKMKELWQKASKGRITSKLGTDLSFEFGDRPVIIGDGMVTEQGEIDFFPGVQVNVAPVEKTINGKVVVDGSISPGGLVSSPVELTIQNGVITEISGGTDANSWSNWLKSLNDPKIYHLCHFSVGLNPRARMSGNMIEDERVVGSVTLGFGNQSAEFKGTVGTSRYHVDVVLTSPEIYIDDKLMAKDNKLNEELGFINLP